jgi:asparagine synthase (glutamine-hydrolysing)
MELEEAIRIAIYLRADEGIVALSGGVDSSLIAALAHLPAVVVGEEGSHDMRRAALVATELGIPLKQVVVTDLDVDEILPLVISSIPRNTVTEVSIATTLFFIAEYAGEEGYARILSGQGADELFGGYARYEKSNDLEGELLRDFLAIPLQLERDQAIATLFHTYFSLPYMDVRVVRAARAISASYKISGGVRKRPLREIACHFLPQEIAYHKKKAMQYGSGIHRILQRLARNNGYKNGVQEYIHHRVESS